VLASRTAGLTAAWSGRPHWFMQHMAVGETIGFSTRLTQNNPKNGLYRTERNSAAGQIHIALMGDPSLRMHPVKPASSVFAIEHGPAIRVSWKPSADKAVLGYHVYRATSKNKNFVRVSPNLITQFSFDDTAKHPNAVYMVRAVKLEQSSSGSYFNASQGMFTSVQHSNDDTQIDPTGRTQVSSQDTVSVAQAEESP
jgi:hypothetical protein